METHMVSKIRVFVRACVNLTGQEVLKLNATQSCQLLEECLLVAQFFNDKLTIMDIVNMTKRLGLMSKNRASYTDAVSFQKLSLRSAEVIDDTNAVMEAYGSLGNAYMFNNQLEDARRYMENAIDIAVKIGNKEAEALCQINLGALLNSLGEHDQAIEYFKKSLILGKEMQSLQIQKHVYCNLAEAYKAKEDFTEALKCNQEYLLKTPHKEYDKLYNVYESAGDCCLSLGKPDKALKYFKKSLEVARNLEDATKRYQKDAYRNMAKANDAKSANNETINCCLEYLKRDDPKRDDPEKCEVFIYLAHAYIASGNSSEAMSYLEKSQEMAIQLGDKKLEFYASQVLVKAYLAQGKLKEALQLSSDDLQLAMELGTEGSAYANQAAVHESLGEYTEAIEYAQKALDITENTGARKVKSSAYGILGDVYGYRGDYHKANEYLKRQLEICTEIDLKEGQINACVSLGTNYKNLGNYYETIKWQEKALQLSIEIGDVKHEAAAYGNLAVAHDLLGQYSKAIAYHKSLIDISRKTNDRGREGQGMINLAVTLLKIGKFKEAMEFLEKALSLALEIGDKSNEAKAYINLAHCKAELGYYSEALHLLENQMRLCEEMQDKGSLSRAFCTKANVYKKQGNFNQAIDCYEKSLKINQEIRDRRGEAVVYGHIGAVQAMQQAFSKSENDEFREVYEPAIYSLRKSLDSWEWIFEHIQEQDHFKVSILDSFILHYKLLSLSFLMADNAKEALLVCERGRAKALDDLLTSKYNIDQNQSKTTSLSIEDVQSMATNFSIIFYSIYKENWLTWTVQDDINVRLDLKEADDPDLNEIVDRAYAKIQIREVECEDRLIQTEEQETALPKKVISIDVPGNSLLMIKQRCVPDEYLYDDDDYIDPLESLYHKLISKVSRDLIHDEIVIIPDEHFFTVPFAALLDPNTGKYLSETKRIRIAPSLTTLKALQDCPADYHSKSGAMVIGNPHVGTVMFRGKEIKPSDLPCAKKEALKISNLLGVQPFIGAQATKENIKKNLKDVVIIHVAAHGTNDGEIFLTPPPSDTTPEEQDYILTMKEVQESGGRPQLVVLSCCHSGRGEVKAEGVVGMSRAFLAAGARAVVVSLWAIADQATMLFMEFFYRHLKEGKSASTSLQQVMKDMRETPGYSEPMFWAPFFLIGDDVTVEL